MDYEGFKVQILQLIGVDLSMYKQNQMKRRIDSLIQKFECRGYEEYLAILKRDSKVLDDFKSYITINVTEFYRNPMQWEVLKNSILPELVKKNNRLRIWSAACSTGDEPYSIAMLIDSLFPMSQVEIVATDIDAQVLDKARKGTYIEKNLCNIPEDYKEKYFTRQENEYLISDHIKRYVNFKQHNLLKDPYPDNMDLIVCRNVLIYFTEEAKNDIYHRFSDALSKDGILFVGSTEQIIMSQEYGFESNKIFFYNKIN